MLTTVEGGPDDTAQMSMKKGLKVFGAGGYATVKQEMQQLHDRRVMQPVRRKDLSPAQKREALGYLMFLKKKRCGKIKGRGCANGRKQRAYIVSQRRNPPRPPFRRRLCFCLLWSMRGNTGRSQCWMCLGLSCRWIWTN